MLRCCLLVLSILALLTSPARADEQVLRLGNGSEPGTLDPALADLNPDLQILHDLFEGLVTIGPSGEVRPGQAEGWTVSPDGMTYRFTLRPGLAWSNGAPLTAEDFAWRWRGAASASGRWPRRRPNQTKRRRTRLKRKNASTRRPNNTPPP